MLDVRNRTNGGEEDDEGHFGPWYELGERSNHLLKSGNIHSPSKPARTLACIIKGLVTIELRRGKFSQLSTHFHSFRENGCMVFLILNFLLPQIQAQVEDREEPLNANVTVIAIMNNTLSTSLFVSQVRSSLRCNRSHR